MDIRTTPVIFLGGGSKLLKRYGQAASELERTVILDDVSLNAKAYERLAERLPQNGSHS